MLGYNKMSLYACMATRHLVKITIITDMLVMPAANVEIMANIQLYKLCFWNTEHYEALTTVENQKIKPHLWMAWRGCCWGCGNVRCIDVSNEERWAPLIHWGWERTVKSYQASQRPACSRVSGSDAAAAHKGAAAPPKAKCEGDAHVQKHSWCYCGVKKDKKGC